MEVINATGRRKTAIARVFLKEGSGQVTVNKRDVKEYFPTSVLQYTVKQAFEITQTENKFDLNVNIDGGGYKGQAEALRMAIARALVKLNPEFRKALKDKGLLRRDPRMVERKKPGQPGARRRFQFSKR
ncbi:MAG: 30S ribosomal protein S9 [Bacteroidales bacterium]|jgi:small subunit ribosomal protein S9|nr:30S ribosomal protein S9 [Bacteroidales bacterium]